MKKKKFSIVKAVKLNARDRVGQPKPEKIIQSKKDKNKYKPDYRDIINE